MAKEKTTMIFLPESIERTLERIEEAYKKDIKKHKVYFSSILKDGKKYTGTDTVRIQLESFKQFKESLKCETSKFLVCEEGKEDDAKIRLMYAIREWYKPLLNEDIYRIENDVYIQSDLKKRLKKLSTKPRTKKEALNLLEFFNNAFNSSWGPVDSQYKIRDFRLVNSKEKFEKILNEFNNVEELTDDKDLVVDFTTIRVALVTMDWVTIYKRKGIFEEYQRFYKKHLGSMNFNDELKMFNLWHDVRETAIYYIYAPEEK